MTMLYVAGPMTGWANFNYEAFDAAARELQVRGFDTLNPTQIEALNDTGQPQKWDWYMRHALRLVLEADALALLPGWERSRGASLEVHVASSLGLPCEPVEHWLNGSP